MAEFRRALELDPNLAIVHSNLGQILYVHNRVNEALTEGQLAAELDPSNMLMRAQLGTMFRDLGRREDAITEYRRAIALDADQAILHAMLGTLLSDMAQNDAAMVEFRRALELDPKLADNLYAIVNSLIDRASHGGSANLANATLIGACWLLVTASHLTPASVDYLAVMQRIDQELQNQQHCPPR